MNYLIWSNEHGAWWRLGSLGYTSDISIAGRYRKDEAAKIVERAGAFGSPEGVANEVMVVAPEHRWDSGPDVLQPKKSITCPICHLTSYSPIDIAEGYCGACHDWTSTK